MIKIQPLGNRFLITEEKVEEKTAGGIVLPDTAEKEKSQLGKILAIGKGKKAQKSGLKEGDKVLFEKFGPTEITIENQPYLIAEISQILAKIK